MAAEDTLRECPVAPRGPRAPAFPSEALCPTSRGHCDATACAAPGLTIRAGIRTPGPRAAPLGLHYLSLIISYITAGRDPALPVSDSVRW